MLNLTNNPERDEAARRELVAASIPAGLGAPAAGTVISPVTGRLGAFTFRRSWSHWAVEGLVPLEAAREMHADPAGRKGLRVGGHGARPAPGEFATVWVGPDGDLKLRRSDKEETPEALAAMYPAAHLQVEGGARVDFVTAPAGCDRGFVDGYHIDTESALALFADTMRRYGLAR